MNVHFSNVNFSSNSGPNSFAARLAEELTLQGHTIVSAQDAYETMLIFIEPASLPKPGTRIVHRLDGIWFKPDQFYSNNKGIKWAYDNCHEVIWQSEFDRNMSENHWGIRQGSVIHNGITLNSADVTNPDILDLKKKYENIFVCSANWHRQKRLKENTELFLLLKKDYPNSCLVIMGSNPDYVIRHEDIFYTGSIQHEMCLEFFSAADWMIHLAWLDHCPNVVVEALSQNCPVICSSSGGTKEIVGKNGIVIPESTPYEYELTDYDSPYELLLSSLELPRFKIDNSYLDIKKVAQKYIRVLENH